MGAADVVGLDLQAGDRVGPGGVGEDEVVVLLVGVGPLGVLLDADHPLPDDPRPVLQARPCRAGRWSVCGADVVLAGEVGQVLPAGGEHHAVDLGLAPCPVSATSWLTFASRDPRPPTVHWIAASGPTSARSRLKCQVRGVPVLDVDEPELRPAPTNISTAPACRRRASPRPRAGRLADAAWPRPLPRARPAYGPRSTRPSRGQPDQAEQRGLDLHPLGHVEQRPAGPERRVRADEGVGRRRRRPRSGGTARAVRDAP